MTSSSGECPVYGLLSAALTGDINLLKKSIADLDDGGVLAKTIEDVKDCEGRMALHYAASEGRTHICKYLVQGLKLDVNMKDGEGETPLSCATMRKKNQTVRFLLENGANPNLANNKGFSALHHAAHKGLKELMRLLILKGAEIDVKSDAGTPLHCAAAQGKKVAVQILLDKKANPNAVCHHIFTPLVNSLFSDSFECTSLLLKAGADPNLGQLNGESPLGFTASEGEAEVMKCLLKAGANPNVTNFIGLTPLEIAVLHGNHEKAKILLPLTSPLPTIPDWNFHGIVRHVYSEEGRRQREQKKNESFLLSKSKGEAAFKEKEYIDAINWYSLAIDACPSDATVLSNRSLCWARLNEGIFALSDAEACVMMRPDWAKAHYREGVAWRLLKNFRMAAYAFLEALKLDPENKELETAFMEAFIGVYEGNGL